MARKPAHSQPVDPNVEKLKLTRKILGAQICQYMTQKVLLLIVGVIFSIVPIATIKDGITVVNVASFIVALIALVIAFTLFSAETFLRQLYMHLNDGADYSLRDDDVEENDDAIEEKSNQDEARELDSA